MNASLPITFQDAVLKVISIIKNAPYSFELTYKHVMIYVNEVVTGNYDRVHKVDIPNQETCSPLSVYIEAINTLLKEGFIIDVTPDEATEDVFSWGEQRLAEVQKNKIAHNEKDANADLTIEYTGFSDGFVSHTYTVYKGEQSNCHGETCQHYQEVWKSDNGKTHVISRIYAPFCKII